MRLYRSNRPERLVDRLCAVVDEPAGGAMEPECIVVQKKGMERWLSQQLADRMGIWANPDFPFPQRILSRAFDALLGSHVATEAYAPDNLVWTVAGLLHEARQPGSAGAAGTLAPICSYLDAGAAQGVDGTVELSSRIARVLDRYVTHRPEMVQRWEQGADDHWQAHLWRGVFSRLGPYHFAARARRFIKRAEAQKGICPEPDWAAVGKQSRRCLTGFPRRLCLFGIGSLPPLYLEVLRALSRLVEVHLFVLSPSKEYWAEIRSRREIMRQLVNSDPAFVADELHLAQGHPLLASLGTLGRDFLQLVEGSCDYQEGEEELWVDPAALRQDSGHALRPGAADGTATLLATLQSDILHLRSPSPAPLDASVRIHACHSPLREIEVVRDQLLDLFESDPTLEPHHVVVLTPDVEKYAPFVRAVFDGESHNGGRIPCQVADQKARAVDAVIDAFGRLLALLPTRFAAGAVLELLAMAPIRERFEISEGDLERLRVWVTQAGIRWGVDAGHRVAVGQPETSANTWRFGLDRLLLGYAAAGDGYQLWSGVSPCGEVTGSDGPLLGRFCDFCAALWRLRRRLLAPRSLVAWGADLCDALEEMVAVRDETAFEHQVIRDSLAEMAAQAESAGFLTDLDLPTVWGQLERRCATRQPAPGFLGFGVTVCDLVPMRTIPFRVVCLVGFGDDAFPRRDSAMSFDLTVGQRRLGDRDRRGDDQYSLLEAVLAARDALIITYEGQGLLDNAQRPPSVAVADLLDVLADSVRGCPNPQVRAGAGDSRSETGMEVQNRLVLRHPLFASSRNYFVADRDPRLFSFSSDMCRAASGPREKATAQRRLTQIVLPPPGDPPVVTIDQLERFFIHPQRSFLRDRLGIRIDGGPEHLAEREPLALGGLDWWRAGAELLKKAVAGEPLAGTLPALRARGLLPLGTAGTIAFDDLSKPVARVAELTRENLRGAQLLPLGVDAQLAGVRLTGALRLWPAGQIRFGFFRLHAKQELRVWIRHLILNWLSARGHPLASPTTSCAIGVNDDASGAKSVTFEPIDGAEEYLAELLTLYRLGQRLPLPFFPLSARVFAASGDAEKGLALAHKKFFTAGSGAYAESRDPYVRHVFAEQNPLAPGFAGWADVHSGDEMTAAGIEFASLATRVFGPLLQHQRVA